MLALSLTVAMLLLAALAVLQVMVALGMPVGEYAWGGDRRVHGDGVRKAARAAVPVYVLVAAILLARGGVLPGRESTLVWALAWLVCVYGAVKVVAIAMSRSRRQRRLMVPVSVLLMLSVLAIASS